MRELFAKLWEVMVGGIVGVVSSGFGIDLVKAVVYAFFAGVAAFLAKEICSTVKLKVENLRSLKRKEDDDEAN